MLKTRIATTIILGAIILSACGGVTPYPTPTISSPTLFFPTTTPLPTLTSTPAVTPTPETLYGYPTPQAVVLPTCNPVDCLELTPNVQRQDFTLHELYVGKYVLRNWCEHDPLVNFFLYCAITISSKGDQQMEIWGYPAEFGEETGSDLTGEGIPDIVIDNWSGGSAGLVTVVYEAGDNLKMIMDIGSDYNGTFKDLNSDGTYEYIAPIRFWSQLEFCNCQVRTLIVYEYNKKSGYIPATYKFKDILDPIIQQDLSLLSEFKSQNSNTKPYPALPYDLAAQYFLAGQSNLAMNILNEYFSPDEVSQIQKELKVVLEGLVP